MCVTRHTAKQDKRQKDLEEKKVEQRATKRKSDVEFQINLKADLSRANWRMDP
jgi:hypothetical protein